MTLRLLPIPMLSLSLLLACNSTSSTNTPTDVPVQVGSVGVDPITAAPVVVLQETAGERSLPIWIGLSEARSIASRMEKIHPPRPNAHDLAKRLLHGLEATVERVVVTNLEGGTYFAVIVLNRAGRQLEIDARPSDAIAIALRVEAPLFVRETLFEAIERTPSQRERPMELRL